MVTDAGVEAVAVGCPLLSTLHLGGFEIEFFTADGRPLGGPGGPPGSITNAVLASLKNHCKNLTHLSIQGRVRCSIFIFCWCLKGVRSGGSEVVRVDLSVFERQPDLHYRVCAKSLKRV